MIIADELARQPGQASARRRAAIPGSRCAEIDIPARSAIPSAAFALRLSATWSVTDGHRDGRHRPGAAPHQRGKGARPHQSPRGAEARSAGYAETCSSGATEARRSSAPLRPLPLSGRGHSRGRNPGVLSDGEAVRAKQGDRETPAAATGSSGPCRTKRVRIPPQGVRATAAWGGNSGESPVRPVQPRRRGEPSTRQRARPGRDQARRFPVSPETANSSTTKGPRGLAGQFRQRREAEPRKGRAEG